MSLYCCDYYDYYVNCLGPREKDGLGGMCAIRVAGTLLWAAIDCLHQRARRREGRMGGREDEKEEGGRMRRRREGG